MTGDVEDYMFTRQFYMDENRKLILENVRLKELLVDTISENQLLKENTRLREAEMAAQKWMFESLNDFCGRCQVSEIPTLPELGDLESL